MVNEASDHEEEDRLRQEQIEARNHLDNMVYGAEKQLSEHADKIPEEMKGRADEALKEAKEVLDSDDADKLKAASEKLEKTLHEIAAAMYQSAGAQGDAGAGPDMSGMGAEQAADGGADGDNGAGGDDVIDAEYEEA